MKLNKINHSIFATLLLLSMIVSNRQIQAQNNSNVAQAKTVAELLKKIEKKSEKVSIQKTNSALPAIKKQNPVQSKVNLREVKPPVSSNLYYDKGTDEAELMKVTDEGIEQLYSLTQRYAKSPKRGELWLRLAEMYVEKARLIEYQLLNKHDVNMQNFLNGKAKQRPQLNLTAAVAYNKKAIQLYEWFLRDFPTDPKVDQALFFLGFNYFELNEHKKGQVYYEQLTKQFPKSIYVDESNFALGEFHFENERWKEAFPYFETVSRNKDGRLYSFALYKLAWCFYKVNQSKKGLVYLERVVLEGRRTKAEKDSSLGGVGQIRLATEAIKDLVVFFAEAGDPTNARGYFEEIVGEKTADVSLEKLAYYYSDTGNRSAAKVLFEDLVSKSPNSLKAFDYKHAIVKMFAATPPFEAELYAWIENYGPNSRWQKLNAKNQDTVVKGNALMEALLRNHVLQLHQTAQNTRTKSAQINANKGYELYFSTFKALTNMDEMHFFYAELLFDVNNYEKAAYYYLWVVENTPNSKYFDKALLNSLLAYEKRLPTDEQIKKAVGDTTAAVEFLPGVQDFEKAANRFLEKAPKSENSVAVRYRLGALYYLFNQFDKAMPHLNEVVKKHSNTPYAKFAANHLLDIYSLRQDFEGLQKAATDILSVPGIASSEVGNQIQDIKLRTEFKLAKTLEEKGDYIGAGKAYEDFAMKNRTNALAAGALFNSAINYEKGGDILRAIAMYNLVADNRVKGNERSQINAAKFLPILYERTGQYLKAAQHYESYSVKNPKDKLAGEYRYNAAVIYDSINSLTPAVRNYKYYFENSRSRDRNEVLFLIAKMYERVGDKSQAILTYDQYLKSGTTNVLGVIEAHYNIAKIHESLNRKKVSEEWFVKTVVVQRRLAKGKKTGASYAAECKLKLVFNTYENLIRIGIPAIPAQQGAAVQRKLTLLNKLKDELKSVVAYDDAFQIVAALLLQGKATQHMYTSLLATPIPKGLKPDELKQYQDGVKSIADPFKLQAIEAYKTAISRGYELQGYSDYLIEASKNLQQIQNSDNKFLDTQAMQTTIVDWLDL